MSVPIVKKLKLGNAINICFLHLPFKKHLYFSYFFSPNDIAGCSWPIITILRNSGINLCPCSILISSISYFSTICTFLFLAIGPNARKRNVQIVEKYEIDDISILHGHKLMP